MKCMCCFIKHVYITNFQTDESASLENAKKVNHCKNHQHMKNALLIVIIKLVKDVTLWTRFDKGQTSNLSAPNSELYLKLFKDWKNPFWTQDPWNLALKSCSRKFQRSNRSQTTQQMSKTVQKRPKTTRIALIFCEKLHWFLQDIDWKTRSKTHD